MTYLKKADASISFFDLDKTLISVTSGYRFGLHLFRQGLVPNIVFGRLMWQYSCYLQGSISQTELHHKTANLFCFGKPLAVFEQQVEPFIESCWEQIYHPIGQKLLSAARERGDKIIILSSSPLFLVEGIAKRLEADECHGTYYRLNDSGVIQKIETILEGKEKARRVVTLAEKYGVPIEETWGFSDSHHDIPFLEAVGKPVAVHPNKKLTAVAKRRGWPILAKSKRVRL